MSDIYNGKWLRRWGLSATGQEECVADAVDVGLLSAEDRAAIEAKNVDIHQAIADVTALEAAYLVAEPGEDVTRTYRVYDEPTIDEETGETVEHWHMETRPEWQAWDDAQELIEDASDDLLALKRIRAGEPAEGDADLVAETWGYVVEVTVRPEMPNLNPAQFWGVVYATDNGGEISAYIDQVALVDPVTAGLIRGKVERSETYLRYDPLTIEMQSWRGMSDEEFNALWLWAAAS